jgi:hypothetical protein
MLGQVIHGYRIDRAMSEDKGGFGDVYFATHVDSGAEAVVKVLKPEMSALRDIVARFFNEARAAASIHHPGIVQIHNVGYHGDRAYLLMERLRGGDLEQRLERGPLPLDRAIIFLRQAAGAIGAAHERGIVHRDLKPANLFVVDDPDVIGGERVKVLDFGIAKLTADSGAGKTQGVFGSPPYMSPEQCASTAAVDARSDLYSLGCIFYELVCGRPPFGHGGIELIASHLRDTPPPPRALAPWVPPAVEQVILALLEKQPERRIPSCAALIAALDEAARVSGLPGASVPHLAAGGGPAVSAPDLRRAGAQPGGPTTTLGSAAVAASTLPANKRGLGVWLGVAAVVVVGGAVTAVIALGGGPSGGPQPPPGGPTDAGIAIAVTADAVSIATATHDAALIAMGTPDAAVDAMHAADPIAQRDKRRDEPPPRTSQGPCDKMDVEGVWSQAATAFARGQPFAALALANKALVCKPNARGYRLAATYACAAHDFNSAKDWLAKLPSSYERSQIEEKCEQERRPPQPTSSMSQAEIAARLNQEGKDLMYSDRPGEAVKKFQEAVARVPEPKYFVNLCTGLLQGGRLDEALTACDAVKLYHPTAEQRDKAARLTEIIRSEATKHNIELHPQR